ncbi:MAG: segregation and condensation protein A [Eubacterium sp.]
MDLSVKLEVFEGPLDLLLHLIEKNKIDIYDIPIVEITAQYMQYVNAMDKEDLNIVSEFLVMAATLIDIKCKMLLPKEVDEEGEEIDPRAELVEKLIEYKKFKYMSYELKDRQLYAGKALYKEPTIPKEVASYKPPVDLDKFLGDVNLERLNEVFQMVMKRQIDRIDPVRSKFGKIEKEEVSLPDKITYVKNYAKRNKRISFKQLLEQQETKMNVIVTFLAVLELIKIGDISVMQEGTFDDITINLKEA